MHERKNPPTIEDPAAFRAYAQQLAKGAGDRFREEHRRLVAAGIIDEQGNLLRSVDEAERDAVTTDRGRW